MPRPTTGPKNIGTDMKPSQTSNQRSPRSLFQPPEPQKPTGPQEAIVFGVTMNGSAAWDSTMPSGDIHNIWDIDISMLSDTAFTNEWIEGNEMSPITPSPPMLAFSYGSLLHRQCSAIERSSSSDIEIQATSTGTQKARRQAQNRAAQRAYRARKEEQLERSRLRTIELEREVQHLQRSLNLSSSQWCGPKDVSALQNKIAALETRNKTLETEYQEMKLRLRRTAATLLESDVDT